MNYKLQTMKNVWFWCVGSLVSLAVGGVLLLLFMSLYIVPHMITSMFQLSSCRLATVCPLQQPEQSKMDTLPFVSSDIVVKPIAENLSQSYTEKSYSWLYNEDICRAITARFPQYNISGNTLDCLYLFAVVHTQHMLTEDTDHVTHNANGEIEDVKEVQSRIKDISHVHLLIEDSYQYYLHTLNQSKCPCLSCRFAPGPRRPRPYIAHTPVSRSWACYVDAPGHIIWSRQSTLVILNVMLWPTLMVIVGFVGAFFGWINLQYEHSCSVCNIAS